MKTIQLNLYHFGELPEMVKQKVIADHADFNVNYDWWDILYSDAHHVGLRITGFNLDRVQYCQAEFMYDAIDTARRILIEHGEGSDTYRSATEFQEQRDTIVRQWAKDEHGEFERVDELDTVLDNCEEDFLKKVSQAYLRLLARAYEHLTSDEAIAEALEANEYWFTADGSMASRLNKLARNA